MKILSRLISTVFGAGYCPLAPGTVGSLLALLMFWFLPESSLFLYLVFVILLFLIGTWASFLTEQDFIQRFGNEKGHDPQVVVIDEVVGTFIAMFAIPRSINFIIAAFILFRFFDIKKPFPVSKSQKLPGGWGIMMDDVIAGIMANVLIHLYILLEL